MARVPVLLELPVTQPDAFSFNEAAQRSSVEAVSQGEFFVQNLKGLGVEVTDLPPVPMFAERDVFGDSTRAGFGAFASPLPNADTAADSVVVAADVDTFRLDALRSRPGVKVWLNSTLTLFGCDSSPTPSTSLRLRVGSIAGRLLPASPFTPYGPGLACG